MKKIEMNDLNSEQKSSMKVRTISAILMVLVALPCVVLGKWFFLAFVILVSGLAVIEFLKAPRKTTRYSPFVYVFIYVLTLSMIYWVMIKNNLININTEGGLFTDWSFAGSFLTFDANGEPKTSLMISTIGVLTLLLVLFFLSITHSDFNIPDVTYLFTMVIFVSVGIQALLFLRYYPEAFFLISSKQYNYTNISTSTLILYVALATICADTGAYFTGILFGKHKMNPRISPKKTWEGFFGGIIFSALISIGFAVLMSYLGYPILPCFDISIPLNWVYIIFLGITMPLIATLGDFIFSALKRHFDIKDFSNMIKGHGGILDRLDSIICVAIYVSSILVLIGNNWSFLK